MTNRLSKPTKTTTGFTIVELSLALAFFSVLLLAIGFLSIHIIGIYQKGLSMKAVSSTSRELISDFSRSISASVGQNVSENCSKLSGSGIIHCKKDHGRKLIYRQNYGTIEIKGAEKSVPFSGVFCTGQHSYIWNTGYALNPASHYKIKSGNRATYNGKNDFRLLKINDYGREACSHNVQSDYRYTISHNYKITGNPNGEELLKNSEDNLMLYDLVVFSPVEHDLSQHAFYAGTFTIGTAKGNIDITGNGDYCKEDKSLGLSSEFNYCAINKFNFAMRAAGEKIDNDN